MIFRQLFDKDSCTYTYLIGDEATGQAALVDPVLPQTERDLKQLQELGLKLVYSFETHVHADHITGTGKLREMTGCRGIVPEHAHVGCADRFIADGEVVALGAITITAIATPGHTDCHMAYRINEDRVLSGDALFIRGCGRTDFQSGDSGRLYDSVTQRLFTLPAATWVFPAHDYRGLTVTTVGEEQRCNPRFTGRTREQFIEFMSKLDLPRPQKIMEALPANEHCGLFKAEPSTIIGGTATQTPNTIDSGQLKTKLTQFDTLLFDVREPVEFAREHIAGARGTPLANLNPANVPHDKHIVVYCNVGVQSQLAAQQLAAAGVAVSHLSGGIDAWKKAGFPTIVDRSQPISLQRQVQIVTGALVALGCILAIMVSPWFLLLSFLIGIGSLLSGVTASCMMTRLLAKLPYNRPQSATEATGASGLTHH